MSAAGFELDLDSLRRALRARGYELESSDKPGASDAEISACELAIRRSLPEAYRAMLRAHNGLALTVDPKPGLAGYSSCTARTTSSRNTSDSNGSTEA